MTHNKYSWLPASTAQPIYEFAKRFSGLKPDALEAELLELTRQNRVIHEEACINLNPGTNVMNPKAEALLAAGLGSRPSLGYPGDKYEMGLEAIEQIEVLTAELACAVFESTYAEIRVGSGAMANLYTFMATCQPGDAIIVPPASIGGHVTHHGPGAAGLYGVDIHAAPIDGQSYSIDIDALREMVRELRPKLITVGGSLNLCHHPVAQIREIADEVGAWVLFDAAHLSGMIAGQAWPNPLHEGAHLMTMSTYKSLGGPPSGLILTHEAELAQRLDQIAFPGLTANFDASKSAALAMSLLDWQVYGLEYGRMMHQTALALANSLAEEGCPVFETACGATQSHQFALEAAPFGGGQTASKRLRQANILACGIGLPIDPVNGDLNGLRLGSNEIVRWGMTPHHMSQLGMLVADVLLNRRPPEEVREDVLAFRTAFSDLHFVRA